MLYQIEYELGVYSDEPVYGVIDYLFLIQN